MHSSSSPCAKASSRVCIATAAAMAVLAGPTHAYIDPGSGSYVLQILFAAAVGAMFYARLCVEAVKRFFRRMIGKKE